MKHLIFYSFISILLLSSVNTKAIGADKNGFYVAAYISASCHRDFLAEKYINAWSEWVKSNYLLSDKENGFNYLEDVQKVLKNIGKTKKKKVELKITSYNIRLGSGKDGDNVWTNRKDATMAMISSQKPSVIGIQEALDYQLDDIVQNCPEYSYVGVGREDGVRSGETMAIFWNQKEISLLDWGNFWLSETSDQPSIGWDAMCRRTATWAKLRVRSNGKVFFMLNTHLDHRGKVAREKGINLIVKKIDDINIDNLPIVLVGDFNIKTDDPLIISLSKTMDNTRETAKNTDNIYSFNGFGKTEPRTLDYIFSRGFKSCISFQTDTTRYVNIPYISDHYPITAIFKF